jgi:hypothetical protein
MQQVTSFLFLEAANSDCAGFGEKSFNSTARRKLEFSVFELSFPILGGHLRF